MRTRRRLLLLSTALLLVACSAVLYVLLHAQHTLDRAAGEARREQVLPYVLRPLDPDALRAGNPGFEPVATTTVWTSAVQLGDDLYLAGPAGLAQYRVGTLLHLWRTGVELPPAQITALAGGRLRNSSEPQVLIATAGAGALVLSPGTHLGAHSGFEQLLPASAAERDLTSLLATPTGDLLLGTRHDGLLSYSGSDLSTVPVHLAGIDAPRLDITALAASGPDTLVGTSGAGVFFLRAGTAQQLTAADGLPDDHVEALAVSATHAYVGTPVGIAEIGLSDSHVTRTLAPGLFAHALAVSGNTLTVGTLDQGLEQIPLTPQPRLRNAGLHAVSGTTSGMSSRIEQAVSTPSGVLILTAGKVLRGTASPRERQWSVELDPSLTGLTDPNVSALALAPDGRLWVGLFDHGLDVLDPATMTRTRHLEDDHLFCLNLLAVDPVRHTVAAATANGLVLFDAAGNPRQTLTRRDGLIADHINGLVFTPEGLAVATPAGITFLNSAGPESLYAFQGLVNNHVYTLALSPDGHDLLAGTLGGLSLLEAQQVRRNVTAANSALKHNWITASVAQGPGSWLIGTYGAGLETVTFQPSGQPTITPVDLPAGAPHDLIINPNTLLSTPTGIYAGTLGHGLLVYNRRQGRWSLISRGLPSLNVTAFAAGAGVLYVGTEDGLVRIAESQLTGEMP